ncbi:hypothetical protein LJC56_11770 [Christensenellaceae bacterium OttesenSCG-928-K19]|nr:hypothetical protein [Christensenellaceae bacterium OttesenSCG-928-K19]
MRQKIAVILLSFICVVVLGACAQTDEIDDSIVGKWDDLTAPVAVDGTTVDYWEFFEDSTLKIIFTDGSDEGVTYRYKLNEKLVDIYMVDNEDFRFSFTKDGREMYNEAGEKVLEKQ